MEKEFDFKDMGKRMPYKVPDAYFKELEETITTRTGGRKPRKQRLWIYVSTLVAAAALTGWLFLPVYQQSETERATHRDNKQALCTPQEKQTSAITISNTTNEVPAPAIEELSDEELEEIIGLASIDVFLN